MKAYKVELLIVDTDAIGPDEIRSVIEDARYPNHCIAPQVKAVVARDIGEWSDDHPLNKRATAEAEYRRLFGEGGPEPAG